MDKIYISLKDKRVAKRALQLNKHLSYLYEKLIYVDDKKLTVHGLREGRLLLTDNEITFKVPIPDVVKMYTNI